MEVSDSLYLKENSFRIIMKPEEEAKYEYLWNRGNPDWCLVRLSRPGRYAIYNRQHKIMLHMADEELIEEIKGKMISNGVPIIDELD